MVRKLLLTSLFLALTLAPFGPASADDDCGAPEPPIAGMSYCEKVPFLGMGGPPANCSDPIGPGWICYEKPAPNAIARAPSWGITPGALVRVTDRGTHVVLTGSPLGSVSYLASLTWQIPS